jgi:predicted transcriptional regulator
MTLNYAEAIYALDDSDLDVYQSRIWLRVLRRKVCFESQRSMAKGMKISLGKVNEALQWLLENGWVVRDVDQSTQRVGYVAVIPDEQTQQNSLHDMNAVLPDERVVLPDEQSVLPRERHLKAKEIKTKEIKKNTPPQKADEPKQEGDHQKLMRLYQDALGYKIPNGAKEAAAAKRILVQFQPEDAVGCYRYLKTETFWQDKHLSLQSVYEQIGPWLKAGKPTYKSKNGRNGHNPARPIPAPASERVGGAF